MLVEIPPIPSPLLDVAQDVEGYSAEISVERSLQPAESTTFAFAALRLLPVMRVAGQHMARGHVWVDDDTLWVDVQSTGPGRYGTAQQEAARSLLSELWEQVHEIAATPLDRLHD